MMFWIVIIILLCFVPWVLVVFLGRLMGLIIGGLAAFFGITYVVNAMIEAFPPTVTFDSTAAFLVAVSAVAIASFVWYVYRNGLK